MKQRPDLDANARDNPRGASLADAAGDDVERVRSGRENENASRRRE